MLKSIGLLETRSLVGAIVAADLMLKNAGIKIIAKSHINSGEVILIIEGETSSVNVAIEIAAEKSKELGELKSFYIINKPATGLEPVFEDLFNYKSGEKIQNSINQTTSKKQKENIRENNQKKKEEPQEEVVQDKNKDEANLSKESKVDKSDTKQKAKKEKTEKTKQSNFSLFEKSNDTISRLRKEALLSNDEALVSMEKESEIQEKKDEPEEKENIQPVDENSVSGLVEHVSSDLGKMNVHQLRKLARSTDGFPIKGREISRANREILLGYFNEIK